MTEDITRAVVYRLIKSSTVNLVKKSSPYMVVYNSTSYILRHFPPLFYNNIHQKL